MAGISLEVVFILKIWYCILWGLAGFSDLNVGNI
jgi:hypothetical protein